MAEDLHHFGLDNFHEFRCVYMCSMFFDLLIVDVISGVVWLAESF